MVDGVMRIVGRWKSGRCCSGAAEMGEANNCELSLERERES
jgi:hypothetical protein